MTERRVIVLGKAPERGRVKTRMVRGGLSEEQAVQLQEACIKDIIHREFDAEREFWTRGRRTHDLWARAESLGWRMREQPTADLGKNLIEAFSEIEGPSIVLGTDSPDVPTDVLELAFESLKTRDVVLGPSFDGGYYLLGLGAPSEVLFEDIDWGTPTVFEQTLQRASGAHMSLKVLPFWHDLDEVADLRRLRVHSGIPGFQSPYEARHVLDFLDANPEICRFPSTT